ncbi:15700_t:CDS:1, partial [Cetraspora pellucida]
LFAARPQLCTFLESAATFANTLFDAKRYKIAESQDRKRLQ